MSNYFHPLRSIVYVDDLYIVLMRYDSKRMEYVILTYIHFIGMKFQCFKIYCNFRQDMV